MTTLWNSSRPSELELQKKKMVEPKKEELGEIENIISGERWSRVQVSKHSLRRQAIFSIEQDAQTHNNVRVQEGCRHAIAIAMNQTAAACKM